MQQGFHTDTLVCEELEPQLNEYVDGELPFEVQPQLFAHLAVCETCRHYLDGLVAFRRIVNDEHLPVPPAVDEAFLQRLASHRESVVAVKQKAARRARARSILPMAGRGVLATLVLTFVVGNLIKAEFGDEPQVGRVFGEEELVNFPPSGEADRDYGAVYVFYPGLTIEADNWVEPVSTEPL